METVPGEKRKRKRREREKRGNGGTLDRGKIRYNQMRTSNHKPDLPTITKWVYLANQTTLCFVDRES